MRGSALAGADTVCVALARALVGSKRVFIGVNTPLGEAAALLARRIAGTPQTILIGAVSGVHSRTTTVSLFGGELENYGQGSAWPFEQVILALSRRGFDAEPVRPLQLDGQGHLALSGIPNEQGWELLGPGPAGLDRLPYLTKKYLCYLTEHSTRVLVPRVGHADTPSIRELSEEGGVQKLVVISPLAVIEITAGDACLTQIHPKVSVDTVLERTGFPMRVSIEDSPSFLPSVEETRLLNEVDPTGCRYLEFMPLEARHKAAEAIWRREMTTL